MKKLLLNRKPVNAPWGGGNNTVKAICEYAPKFGYEVVHKLEANIDVLFLFDPRYDEIGIGIDEIANYKIQNPGTKIVHRINECDARKGTSDMDCLLVACSTVTDVSIFISKWLMDYFITEREWFSNNLHYIHSGVDKNIFSPSKEKIDNDKINIVVHHWSDNLMKNKFTHKLDKWVGENSDKYTFTYIGRAPKGLKNTIIIPPKHGKELGDLLQKYDVVVNSSLFDPAPNSVIESLASGLPVFIYKDGGGGVELVNKVSENFVYNDFDDLVQKLTSYTKEDFSNLNIGWPVSWENCMKNYFSIIDKL